MIERHLRLYVTRDTIVGGRVKEMRLEARVAAD